jgi:hypothetical protein
MLSFGSTTTGITQLNKSLKFITKDVLSFAAERACEHDCMTKIPYILHNRLWVLRSSKRLTLSNKCSS